MIGRMIRAFGADDVVPLGSQFGKLRFQDDKKAVRADSNTSMTFPVCPRAIDRGH
jgi:hypothetical protein